jgi:hypothetical protein
MLISERSRRKCRATESCTKSSQKRMIVQVVVQVGNDHPPIPWSVPYSINQMLSEIIGREGVGDDRGLKIKTTHLLLSLIKNLT